MTENPSKPTATYSAVLTGANFYKLGPHQFRNGVPEIVSVEVRDYLERTAAGLFTFTSAT